MLPASRGNRARIVLSNADGETNLLIAQRLKLTGATVGKWRARFVERRIVGLYVFKAWSDKGHKCV